MRILREVLARALAQRAEYVLTNKRVMAAARRVLAPYKGVGPVELRAGALVIRVRSPALRAELGARGEGLREAINALLGEELVKEVRVVGA